MALEHSLKVGCLREEFVQNVPRAAPSSRVVIFEQINIDLSTTQSSHPSHPLQIYIHTYMYKNTNANSHTYTP